MASEYKEEPKHIIFNNANMLSYISDYLESTSKLNYIKAISGSNKIRSKQIRFNYVVEKDSKLKQILCNYEFMIKVKQFVNELNTIRNNVTHLTFGHYFNQLIVKYVLPS